MTKEAQKPKAAPVISNRWRSNQNSTDYCSRITNYLHRAFFHASSFLILLLISTSSFVILPSATGADLKLPPYSRVTLSNRMTLLLMEQHEVPMVSFNVLV